MVNGVKDTAGVVGTANLLLNTSDGALLCNHCMYSDLVEGSLLFVQSLFH